MAFDAFEFLRNRKKRIPPTQEELETFNLFVTQMALSMAKGVGQVLEYTNTESFFKLPKKYQCLAFTALDGNNLTGVWQKSKKKARNNEKKELKEKILKLFKCSEHQAETYINYKLITGKDINALYEKIYEPGKVKIREKNE